MPEKSTSLPPLPVYRAPAPDLYPAAPHCQANGISRQGMYRLIRDGTLQTVLVRGRRYIRKSDWRRYLANLKRKPPVDPYDLSALPEIH